MYRGEDPEAAGFYDLRNGWSVQHADYIAQRRTICLHLCCACACIRACVHVKKRENVVCGEIRSERIGVVVVEESQRQDEREDLER